MAKIYRWLQLSRIGRQKQMFGSVKNARKKLERPVSWYDLELDGKKWGEKKVWAMMRNVKVWWSIAPRDDMVIELRASLERSSWAYYWTDECLFSFRDLFAAVEMNIIIHRFYSKTSLNLDLFCRFDVNNDISMWDLKMVEEHREASKLLFTFVRFCMNAECAIISAQSHIWIDHLARWSNNTISSNSREMCNTSLRTIPTKFVHHRIREKDIIDETEISNRNHVSASRGDRILLRISIIVRSSISSAPKRVQTTKFIQPNENVISQTKHRLIIWRHILFSSTSFHFIVSFSFFFTNYR